MGAIKTLFVALALAAGLWGCASPPPHTAKAVDSHNSRNSLSWAGVYEGVLPCADCPGIKTRLTLRRDSSYELVTEYLERPLPPQTVRGQFTWNAAGGAITLDAAGGGQPFMVGEGRLLQLNRDGSPLPANAPMRVLTQVRVD
jgi:uncharacterized lipoprotein NlpE involved in copper resistance